MHCQHHIVTLLQGLKYLCVLATAVKPVTEVRVDVISPATFTEWLAMKQVRKNFRVVVCHSRSCAPQIIPTLVNLVTDMVISDLALSSILSIALVCGKGDSPVTTAVLDELWESKIIRFTVSP